jgi:SAM-dependent methyltransferase
MTVDIYTSGEYLALNPTWHAEDSPWKAEQILKMIRKNNLQPRSICEVGCGAGQILCELQKRMAPEVRFKGYEISPQAFKICRAKSNPRLDFELKDILKEQNIFFDLLLIIDIIEHLEDYYGFLKSLKTKSEYKILHIPLELTLIKTLFPSSYMRSWRLGGHIHVFTRDMALQILKNAGYEVMDYFYTAPFLALSGNSLLVKIARVPRALFYLINKNLGALATGGCSLMVLAK